MEHEDHVQVKVARWIALFWLAGGCTKPNPEVCCETSEQCAAIDTMELRPCGDGLMCSENKCVPAADAAIDARPIDARGPLAFDVAYPSQWTFSVEGPISGYFLVIGTAGNPIDMSTLELKSIEDDHPTAIVRVNVVPSPNPIPQGSAGGKLTPLSQGVLVDSGIVTEPRTEIDADYLTLAIQSAPSGMYDINVVVEVAIESVRVPLHLQLHMLTTPVVYANPEVGTRTSIYR